MVGQTRYSRTKKRRLACEALEPRIQMDNTSAQWSNALSLSLSFVPDGTLLGDATSSLEATLAGSAHLTQWKSTITRAFQTWAQYANINVGIVADQGQPIGAAGAIHGDDRFGDIRIAGYALAPDTMAEAVSQSRTIAGTAAGDVVFNTSSSWPDEATLFSVALHEAGHTLGLGHSTDPNSPMFTHGASQTTGPTAADIANLQALYGARRGDVHETNGDNNSIAKATRIPYSEAIDGFDGTTPLVVYGDIQNSSDEDVFELPVLTGYTGALTFELHTQGMSQLHGTFSVTDRQGNVVTDTAVSGDMGGVYTLHIAAANQIKYYLHMSASAGDLFASGAYAMATKYDTLNTVADSVLNAAILKGHRWQANTDDNFAKVDFRKLLTTGTPVLDNDSHADDSTSSGKALLPFYDTAASRRYQFVGTLSDATDHDTFRLRAQNSPSSTRNLTVTIETLELNAIVPQVNVFDSRGTQLPVTMLANGNGVVMLRVDGIEANKDYFVQLSAVDGAVGNYVMRSQFEDVAINRHLAFSDALTTAQGVREANLYVARPQLMSFALQSTKTDSASAVEPIWARVIDENNNTVVFLGTSVGTYRSSNSVSVLPGTYRIRIEGLAADGVSGPNANFDFYSDGISDPIAAPTLPPDQQPIFEVPGSPGVFVYPGQPPTTDPVLVVPDPVISNPTPTPITPPPDVWFWPTAHAPVIASVTTKEDKLSGPIVVLRNIQDSASVSRVKISGITGGSLFASDGRTPIPNGTLLSFTETSKGLHFLPSANSSAAGHFIAEPSVDGRTAVGNVATQGTVAVTPVGDLPLVGNGATLINTMSAPIVIDPNPVDAGMQTAFKISSIVGGTLYQADGVTQILSGDVLDSSQAHAGVRFLPDTNSTVAGTFAVQAGKVPLASAVLSPTAVSTISVNAPLTLQIQGAAVSENGTVSATVRRGSSAVLSDPLTVSLISSDPTRATVPSTVVIPAGLASVNFTITPVDNALLDGPQSITITSSANGYVSGSGNLVVTDDEDTSPYHNPKAGQRSDANLDQKTDIFDILAEVFYFNKFTDGILPAISALNVSYFAADPTGDNHIDIRDILMTVFDFNSTSAPEGEVVAVATVSPASAAPPATTPMTIDSNLLAIMAQDMALERKQKAAAAAQ